MALVLGLTLAATSAAWASTPGLSVNAAWQQPDRVHAVTGLYAGTYITYTVTDGSSSPGRLYDVTFSDRLPAEGGVQFYPAATGTYTGCGSAHVAKLSDGLASVRISGLTVAHGTECTIRFGAVGTTPGVGHDHITGLAYSTSSGGSLQQGGSATPATLRVLQQPAIAFTAPTANRTYGYGRRVVASYRCSQSDFAGGITGCYGYDDLGHEIDSGSYLDTLSVGTHVLTVFATNIGDGFGESAVSYNVKPFAIRHISSRVRKPLRFSVELPLRGQLRATIRDGNRKIAGLTTQVGRAGTVRPKLRLNKRGRRLLAAARRRALRNARRQARRHHHHRKHGHTMIPTLRVTLRVSFRPSAAAAVASPYFTLFSAPAVTVTRDRVRLH